MSPTDLPPPREQSAPSSPPEDAHPPVPTVGASIIWLCAFLLLSVVAIFLYLMGFGIYLGVQAAAEGLAAPEGAAMEAIISTHLSSPQGMGASYILQALVIIPFVLMASNFKHQPWQQTLALRPFHRNWLYYWGIVLAIYMVVQHVLQFIFTVEVSEFLQQLASSKSFLAFIAIAIFAPVLEELVFRGYLFAAWRQTRLGLSGTLVLTSSIFTALHIGQYGVLLLIILFIFSIILGLARERTGSLWVPIILHALNNVISGVTIIYFGWL